MTDDFSQIAIDIDDVTPRWLTAALRARDIDVEVASVVARPLGTGQVASTYRLSIDYSQGDGPRSMVVKLAAADPQRRVADAFTYRCEVGFYRQVAPRIAARIPQCHMAVASADGTTFTLLLEDVADAEVGDQIAGCSVGQALEAAINLAGLHGPLWCDDSLRELTWLIPAGVDIADISATFLADSARKFVDRFPLDSDTAATLTDFADRSVSWWRRPPHPFALLHGDYRLDNLLFESTGSPDAVVALDWQSCMIGQPLRDVAYVVVTGLEVEDRRASERDIVGAYHAALSRYDIGDYDLHQCWEDYRHGVFHAAMISIFGAAASIPSARGDRMFTVMAERSAAAIRDLDALSLL